MIHNNETYAVNKCSIVYVPCYRAQDGQPIHVRNRCYIQL